MNFKLIKPDYSALIAELSMHNFYFIEGICDFDFNGITTIKRAMHIDYDPINRPHSNLRLGNMFDGKYTYYNKNDPKNVESFIRKCLKINLLFVEKNGNHIEDIIKSLNYDKCITYQTT